MQDGPPPGDGVPITCNQFNALAVNDILRSVTFSPQGQNQSVASFCIPTATASNPSNTSSTEIFINAYGDTVGGSIEVLGSRDSLLSENVAGGAVDGEVKIDVVMRAGEDAPRPMVCSMKKEDGSLGVGVYVGAIAIQPLIVRSAELSYIDYNPQTRVMSSGHSSDVLVAPDPSLSFLILVRFPPAVLVTSPSYINNFRLQSSIMGVNIGEMHGIAEFGNLTVAVGRGGISVGVRVSGLRSRHSFQT
jgi:hypothetical protein